MTELEQLIPQYAQNKSELDSYKKICDKENARIKELMAESKETKVTAGGYTASYIVSTRDTMNEEKLLNIAHKYNIQNVIKTKEYIDFDALEDAIYHGNIIQPALLEMETARESKEVVTLRITKAKKEKE